MSDSEIFPVDWDVMASSSTDCLHADAPDLKFEKVKDLPAGVVFHLSEGDLMRCSLTIRKKDTRLTEIKFSDSLLGKEQTDEGRKRYWEVVKLYKRRQMELYNLEQLPGGERILTANYAPQPNADGQGEPEKDLKTKWVNLQPETKDVYSAAWKIRCDIEDEYKELALNNQTDKSGVRNDDWRTAILEADIKKKGKSWTPNERTLSTIAAYGKARLIP